MLCETKCTKMKTFVITLALLACLAQKVMMAPNARAESSDEEEKKYRLDKDGVKPTNYKITLTMTEEGQQEKVLSTTFKGTVNITLDQKPDRTKPICLHHSKEMLLTSVKYCKKELKGKTTYDDKAEIMTIDMNGVECTEPEDKLLNIEYDGHLYDDTYGFYISTINNSKDNKKYTFATTQFQGTFARRAFPCFDEPSFKATFDITIKYPENYKAMSNQPAKTATADCTDGTCTSFKVTPTMSTYLVAFVVYPVDAVPPVVPPLRSDPTDAIICKDIKKADPPLVSTEMQVCAPAHLEGSMTYAIEKTEAILDNLNKFTGIKYEEMNAVTTGDPVEAKMEQLNQIAIPDFAAGAMENWGLVTYRETALLHDADDSTGRDKQRISSVIAHEFAHMWFGNLVTLKWWDSTWLNEGFARYFEYHVINELQTDWQMADQFVIEQMHSIFQQDVTGALPLTSKVYTQSGIKTKFGSITYNKGACIIRMLERALFDEACKENDQTCQYFKNGINAYLTENKYKNTIPKNLFDTLEASAKDKSLLKGKIVDFMTKWTEQTGYPVVHVSIKDNKLNFEQKQFKYSTDDKSDNTWLVPISYYFDKETKSVSPTVLLKDRTIQTGELTDDQKDSFVVVNVDQTGYYRVHYENDLMEKLATGLEADGFSGISEINRAQIVDDTFNLARVGNVDYPNAFNIINFLAKDESYFSWYAAFNGFSYLRRRFPEGDLKNSITELLEKLMEKVYNGVKFEAPTATTKQIELYKKVLVLQWACEIGFKTCREDALKMFNANEGKPKEEAEKAAEGSTNADLRKIVYCEAARESTDNWDKIWKLFEETDSAAKKVTIITALGCSNDAKKLESYLEKSITDNSGIRSQDAYSVFTSVLTGTPQGVDVALKFLINKYQEIRSHYTSMNALSTVITSVADRLVTTDQANKFNDFLNKNKDDLDDAKDIIPAAKATVSANQKWVDTYRDELLKTFDLYSGAGNLIATSFSALVFIVLSLNYLF